MAKEDVILETLMDIKTTQGEHTQAIKNVQEEVAELRSSCPVWEVESRVQKIESDHKWYNKIVGVVGGFIGATVVVIIEWLFHRSK